MTKKSKRTQKGDPMSMTAKELLDELKKVQGVKTILLVGRDGFCIEGFVSAGMDIDALSALFSTSMGPHEVMGNDLKIGELKQTMIEYNGGNIILSSLNSNSILGVVTDANANLGALRYSIKKISQELLKAL